MRESKSQAHTNISNSSRTEEKMVRSLNELSLLWDEWTNSPKRVALNRSSVLFPVFLIRHSLFCRAEVS